MGDEKLWLYAADSLVDAYLTPRRGSDFDSVSVLSALQHLAESLYYLDHRLFSFISDLTRIWFCGGMSRPVSFVEKWAEREGQQ